MNTLLKIIFVGLVIGQGKAVASTDATNTTVDVIVITNATSSSHGTHSPKYPHYAIQAIDGDRFTCWSSKSLATSNEWIQLWLGEPSQVSAIRIVNGWIPKGTPDWYITNHRAKDITVVCGDGVPFRFLLKDTHEPQTIPFGTTGVVSNVRITIDSVYTNDGGGDRPSITITEIELLKRKETAPTKF